MNLVDRLTNDWGYPLLLDQAALAVFAEPQENSVILLPANPLHYPETLDVAVVLPELVQFFSGRMQAAVADATFVRELAGKYSITEWPALLFLRHGAYLGSIARIQDWTVYLSKINALLDAAAPAKTPGIGIPVVGVLS